MSFTANKDFIDMEIIKEIESGGNPEAVSAAGARGLYQIMPITLKEFNDYHPGGEYTLGQLFNAVINTRIARWYMLERLPQLLKHSNIPITTELLLIAYNWGPGNLREWYLAGYREGALPNLPKQTWDYIQRYKTLAYLRRG